MTIHRPPPAPETTALPALPAPSVSDDGRWSWPDLLHYWVETGIGEFVTSPYPPHEREPMALTMARPETRKDTSPAARQPRTAPYKRIIHEGALAAVDALERAGMLSDPRHTGCGTSEFVGA